MRIDEPNLPSKTLFCLAFLVAALVFSGCGDAGNMEESSEMDVRTTAPAQPEPAPEPVEPQPVEQRQQAMVEGSYLEDTRWAPGHKGNLI